MKYFSLQAGQALVTLLLFTIIGTLLTSAAMIIIVVNAKSVSRVTQASMSRSVAESGIENALLRLLRNPSYTGEVLSLNGGSANVQVTGSNSSYVITSIGTSGNFVHTLQASANVVNNVLTVTSWKEL